MTVDTKKLYRDLLMYRNTILVEGKGRSIKRRLSIAEIARELDIEQSRIHDLKRRPYLRACDLYKITQLLGNNMYDYIVDENKPVKEIDVTIYPTLRQLIDQYRRGVLNKAKEYQFRITETSEKLSWIHADELATIVLI